MEWLILDWIQINYRQKIILWVKIIQIENCKMKF